MAELLKDREPSGGGTSSIVGRFGCPPKIKNGNPTIYLGRTKTEVFRLREFLQRPLHAEFSGLSGTGVAAAITQNI